MISGPEATAGSIPIFLNSIGIRDPTRLAITVVKISYSADKTKVGKDVLKILKKSEGKYEGK